MKVPVLDFLTIPGLDQPQKHFTQDLHVRKFVLMDDEKVVGQDAVISCICLTVYFRFLFSIPGCLV